MKKREREDVRERRGRHIGGDREDGGDRERRERERDARKWYAAFRYFKDHIDTTCTLIII